MEALADDMPKIMEQLVIGEGVYAVGQARRICKEDGIVNNGTYRMNFHAGDKALSLGANEKAYDGGKIRRSGPLYSIDVYNNLDYWDGNPCSGRGVQWNCLIICLTSWRD